jgi:hypothetical protein
LGVSFKWDSTVYSQLVNAALCRQAYDTIDELVLSLPLLTFADYSGTLKKRFCGDLKVSPDRTIFVHSTDVRPQGIAAAQGLIDPEVHPNLIGFDLGSFTLDIFMLVNGSFENTGCESLPIGMDRFTSEILSNIHASLQHPVNEEFVYKVKKILLSGVSEYLGTGKYSFNQLLSLAPSSLEQLRNVVQSKAPEGLKIVAVGGGSKIIEHVFRNRESDLIKVPSPSFSNVIGMMKDI